MHIKDPAIIIAGSGMCTGGRIVDHLKHGLDDPQNNIFFVGYQVKGTLGGKMIEKMISVTSIAHHPRRHSPHPLSPK